MTTHVEYPPRHHPTEAHGAAASYLVPVGRVLFSLIFITASLSHFTSGAVAYAASQGVPMAGVVVPLAGLLALVGGLSVAFGFHAKLGAWLLVAFLVPVTLMMHRFWAVHERAMAQVQMAMFMKNVSLLGAALLITYFGAGPKSLDARHA
jgi:putative oxidoreductase